MATHGDGQTGLAMGAAKSVLTALAPLVLPAAPPQDSPPEVLAAELTEVDATRDALMTALQTSLDRGNALRLRLEPADPAPVIEPVPEPVVTAEPA